MVSNAWRKKDGWPRIQVAYLTQNPVIQIFEYLPPDRGLLGSDWLSIDSNFDACCI